MVRFEPWALKLKFACRADAKTPCQEWATGEGQVAADRMLKMSGPAPQTAYRGRGEDRLD